MRVYTFSGINSVQSVPDKITIVTIPRTIRVEEPLERFEK